MTREEAKLILQENFGLLSFEYPGRISEAIKIAIEVLSQLSLPSDFDEAAKQFQRRWDNDQSPEASFKAGAQWRDAQIPKLPDSIDDAAEKYELSIGSQDYCYLDVEDAFKAGAEWMAGRDKEKIEQAFFSGYNECEDRMKKEFERRAMAGEVNNTGYPTTIQLHTFDSSLKNGDKVNIIIIKQEQD